MLLQQLPLIASLLLVTASASALPSLNRRNGLPGAYYTCTEPNFGGQCQWTAPNTGCHVSPPGGAGIASLGPDPGTSCRLYEDIECSGRTVMTVWFPGMNGGMPEFGAFRCTKEGGAKRDAVVKELEGGVVVGKVERLN
ncbi:hypothetical protein EJ02DRAFT_28134 [Clathrospora elynae]|uniref:Uncharacterized protein n=1 Tax=Clathrospora elynae TaxID=706981 RepID=A0A6A5SM40_9PLEO|nr:hypothetical protein EJ02DRAFT_28134 [Clathrospora elynae]